MTTTKVKTFLHATQSRKPAKLLDSSGSKELFYNLFPYFEKYKGDQFYYVLNIIFDTKDQIWGCSFCVFCEDEKFYEPQYLVESNKGEDVEAVGEFSLLPNLLFEHSEKDILFFYDVLGKRKIEDIINLWLTQM